MGSVAGVPAELSRPSVTLYAMRIVTWNLGAAFGPYIDWHERAWHWLAALDADLALLQECVPPAWAHDLWTVLTLPYTHWASALVAKPSLGIRAVTLGEGTLLGRFGSYLATGEMTLADGGSILVASVHTRAAEAPKWVTDGHDRTAIARSSVGVPWSNDVAFAGYLPLVAGRPFIIGGDWNTARYVDADGLPNSEGVEFFRRAESAGWVELSVDADGLEGRTWYGSDAPRPYQPDHVFADAAVAASLRAQSIEAYPVERLGLSDHAPIVLELGLSMPDEAEDRRVGALVTQDVVGLGQA